MRSLPILCVSIILMTPPALVRASEVEPADLEAFVDGFIRGRMLSEGIVGVTVSVVHNQKVILSKDTAMMISKPAVRSRHPVACFGRDRSRRR